MLLLMPKRKARKRLSSDGTESKAARVQLETVDERCERLRTTRERMAISTVRIPKNVDISVYDMMQ